MSNFFNHLLRVSLIFLFPLVLCAAGNSKAEAANSNNGLFFNESKFSIAQSLLYSKNNFSIVYSSSNRDGFFRRIFGRKKTVAERNSQSKAHPTTRQQKYTPPRSNSQLPMGNTISGPPNSTDNSAIHNVPKEPLIVSRRDRVMNVGPKWQLGFSLGSSHAIADIGDSKNMDFGDFVSYQTSNLGFNFGLYGKYMFNSWFAASFGMDYGSYKGVHNIEGSDYDGFRFENDVFEFFAKTEFHVPFLAKSNFDFYAFTGIGIFFNDTRLYNNEDRRHREPNSREYSQIQPAIPVGIGFGYFLNNKVRIGYELGYRYTMFSYFDGIDISNSYDRYFSNALKVSFNF